MKRCFAAVAAAAMLLFFSCGSAPTDDSLKSGLTDANVEAEADESGEAENKADALSEEEVQAKSEAEEETAKSKAAAIKQANDEAFQKVQTARQDAVDAWTEDYAPEQLAKADALLAEAKRRADGGEDMTKGFAQIEQLYRALEEYSNAMMTKERIDEEDLSDYNESDYAKGDAAIAELEELMQDDNTTSAQVLEKAHLAYVSYNRVLIAALKGMAQEERRSAFNAKRNADGVYANVSRKDDYNEAVKEFRAGDASYAMQNPEAAAEHYTAAKEAFNALYTDIGDKLSEAEAAIREAQEASAGSEEYARQADEEAPLEGEDIEGIEEPDAVLLDDLEYDDPMQTIEVIPYSIDDMDDEDEADEQDAADDEDAEGEYGEDDGDADDADGEPDSEMLGADDTEVENE